MVSNQIFCLLCIIYKLGMETDHILGNEYCIITALLAGLQNNSTLTKLDFPKNKDEGIYFLLFYILYIDC